MNTTEDRIDAIDLQPSKGKCFLVPTTILTDHGKHEIKTLLDSGASRQFINQDLVNQLKLPKYPLKKTINIFNADGSKNKCSYYTEIKIRINNRTMTIKPKIVTLGTKPLFLGITWLRQYNPDIDWENAILKWRDEDESIQLMEIDIDDTINYIDEEDEEFQIEEYYDFDKDDEELMEFMAEQVIDQNNNLEEINVKQNK